MGRNSRFTAAFLVFLFVLQAFEPFLSPQTAPLTPQQLDQLLSPIALYPDSLLSQILTASTNPQEILDVDNWLYQNPGLSRTALTDAAQRQEFDPVFIALVNFPQVLEMMAQHIDDYAASYFLVVQAMTFTSSASGALGIVSTVWTGRRAGRFSLFEGRSVALRAHGRPTGRGRMETILQRMSRTRLACARGHSDESESFRFTARKASGFRRA